MAVKLPTAIDYGARPSLRSSRVDVPGTGELATGEALQRAASTFANMAIEKKEKQDRLNYSLAKNEILSADIRRRAELDGDEDWATYDQRYTEGLQTDRDEIFGRYRLTNNDRALLSAESDLITERGRVNVGNSARVVELDQYKSNVDANLIRAREQVLNADPDTANDIMITQIENLRAAEDRGIYTDQEVLTKIQSFVSDTSLGRLEGMNADQRIAEIELSLAGRKARGPVTIEDIEAGKGTGSIADFMTKDVLVKMLDTAKKESEIELRTLEAQQVVDAAWIEFPTDQKSRMKYIRENTAGRVRTSAVALGLSRGQEDRVQETQDQKQLVDNLAQSIRDFDLTFEELDGPTLARLGPAGEATIRAFAKMHNEGKQFADFTQWIEDPNGGMSYSYWNGLTDSQKAAEDLDSAEWRTKVTQPVWKQMNDHQEAIKNDKQAAMSGGLTNLQLVERALVAGGYISGADRSDTEKERLLNASFRFDQAVQEKMAELGRNLTNEERRKVLSEIMIPVAYTDTPWWGVGDQDVEQEELTMTATERDEAYLPYAKALTQKTTGASGIEMTVNEKLLQMAKDAKYDTPSKHDIERAFWALDAGLGDAEVLRRLKGE